MVWAERIFPDPSSGEAGGRLSGHDLVAGLSVAFILIPQAIAYADLAGMPPQTGLYAAAVAPVAGAIFASSAYIQTGPVALTSLLTFGALLPMAPLGSREFVALAALLALVVGVTRIALGMLRFGFLAYLMSQPLLLGFTSAAGVLIVASQVPAALGVQGVAGGVVGEAAYVLGTPSTWDPTAAAVTASTILVIVGGARLHALFPGVLVATVGGILFSVLTDYRAPTLGALPGGIGLPSFDLPWTRMGALLVPGVVIGLVGFAEPASIARTYAAEDRDPWNPNREFVSQGVANLLTGLFGGFPVGGSFSRSSVNRLAGATSRWSGAVAGGLVLLFLPFARVLAPMPTAVIAGIIIAAVVGLVRPRALFTMLRLSRLQALVGWSTFFLTLALAPQIEQAVLLGILFSVGVHLWRELPVSFDTWMRGREIHVSVEGVLWFGSAPVLEEALLNLIAEEKDAKALVIHLQGIGRIDLTGARMLETIIDDARSAGLQTWLEGVPPHAYRIFRKVLGWHPVRESPEREAEKKEREKERKEREEEEERQEEAEQEEAAAEEKAAEEAAKAERTRTG